jgi:hypothetical protein
VNPTSENCMVACVIPLRCGNTPTQQLTTVIIERDNFFLGTAKINAQFHFSPVSQLCILFDKLTYSGNTKQPPTKAGACLITAV